jgi:hypothetical protein
VPQEPRTGEPAFICLQGKQSLQKDVPSAHLAGEALWQDVVVERTWHHHPVDCRVRVSAQSVIPVSSVVRQGRQHDTKLQQCEPGKSQKV